VLWKWPNRKWNRPSKNALKKWDQNRVWSTFANVSLRAESSEEIFYTNIVWFYTILSQEFVTILS
jgi:hypothetical protein